MSKYVGGYHTLRPKEDHMSKTMANIDVKLAEQTANDPKATPMQKAIALTKINPQLAAKVHGDMMASEQAKQMQANDAKVMQSMGITPSQGNPNQLQQPVKGTPSMLEISEMLRNRAPPQEMPMHGFGLTAKKYAPVAQLQEDPQVQAGPRTPQSIGDILMSKSIPELIELEAKLQNPEQKKQVAQFRDAKQKEAANAAQTEKANIKVRADQQKDLAKTQEDAMGTIKRTGSVIKSLEDQITFAKDTGQFSAANLSSILRSTGYDALANAVQSEAGAIFSVAGKEVITGGLKDAFGARPLGTEFALFEQMMAQPGRFPRVNELTAKSLMIPYKIENDIANYKLNLIAENPDISPVALNSETYKYGESIRNEYLNAWKQEVNEVMADQKRGWFDAKPTKTESKVNSWVDLWK